MTMRSGRPWNVGFAIPTLVHGGPDQLPLALATADSSFRTTLTHLDLLSGPIGSPEPGTMSRASDCWL